MEINYYTEFAEACAKGMPEKDCRKYFKRYDHKELPRIIKALGFLKSVTPTTLLDVGPGRGRSLWPIAYALPQTNITCIDKSKWRCEVIGAVHKGGVHRITIFNVDASNIPFKSNSFDVVSALEVIEHIPNAQNALIEVARVARNFIIISVPSKPDNNPDHVHFFTKEKFEDLLDKIEKDSGKIFRRITFDYVPNHMLVVIRLSESRK